jgi:hypothetical protein
MTTVNFVNPRARFFDANGKPLSGGRVAFYSAGTNTLKQIYSDYAGTTPASNPNTLNAEGYAEDSTGIHLGDGLYDIVVQERTSPSTWSTIWTYPNIAGSNLSTAGSILLIGYVNNIEELRNLPTGSYNLVFVAGYYEAGDGGARWMQWNPASVETENGGTVIVPYGTPASGRFGWLPQSTDTVITPQLFGGFPSNGSLVIATQVSFMINWCLANDYKDIHFNLVGDYYVNSSTTFSGDLNVTIDSGVKFANASGTGIAITFNCESVNIKGKQAIASPSPSITSVSLVINTKQPMNVLPEWWGAVGDGGNVSWTLNVVGNSISSNHTIQFTDFYGAGTAEIDYTDKKLLFEEGSYIDCDGSDLIIDKLTSNSTSPIFRGAYLDLIKFVSPSCKSEWLEWTSFNIIKTFLNDFITLNTFDGNRQFNFIVGAGVHTLGYAINEAARSDKYFLNFNWTFEEGSRFSCNATGFIDFGYVTAGGYQIFSPIVGGDFHMRFVNNIKLPWFGAISSFSDTVDNANAIRSAYSQVVASNGSNANDYIQRISLDLCGGTYKTNVVDVTYNSNFSDAIVPIKNGVIWGDVDTVELFGFGHGIEGTNLQLESRGDNSTLLYVDKSTIKFNRSNLISRDTLIDSDSTSKLVITDSDLYVTDATASTVTMISHNGKNSVIKDCILHRLNVDATGACNIVLGGAHSCIKHNESEGVTIATKGEGVISDNFLVKASIIADDPANVKITGNTLRTSDHMDAKILFTTSSLVGYSADGLYCCYNSFVDGVSDPLTRSDYVAIDISFASVVLIANAEVHSNDISGATYNYLQAGTTRFDVKFDYLAGQTEWGFGFYNIRLDFSRSELSNTQRYFAIFNGVNARNVSLTERVSNGSVAEEFNYIKHWKVRQNVNPPIIDIDFEIAVNDFQGDLIFTCETSNLNGFSNAKIIPNPLFP